MMEVLKGKQVVMEDGHKPVFFRLSHTNDRMRLEDLLNTKPHVWVHDRIMDQLQELVRTQDPRLTRRQDIQQAAIAHLGDLPAEEYGVWVYYPWSNRLVHLLDEEEFKLVRTDRNRNKITREEQRILSTKKVGVIGLSVGQSVSLTMALERSFGEIRLADHDTLELSNLNRIRSGVHGMGVNKAVNVAREIAEIDPFLKVTCYKEGITRENMHDFFTEGGKLNVLIEECDSVDIKILARLKARELGVPVVMDTSDRGLVDVERFDLEPDRPLLHGNLEGLDLSVVGRPMTNEEKLPLMGRIVGLDTISERMKTSIPEIGRSLITWPQLASGVILGGALVGDVWRRIALDQFQGSGRWWNDPSDNIRVEPNVRPAARSATDQNQDHGQDNATRVQSSR